MGVPRIRILIFGGLYGNPPPPFLGNYHIEMHSVEVLQKLRCSLVEETKTLNTKP